MNKLLLFLMIAAFPLLAQYEQGTYFVPASAATSRLATAVPTNDLGMINENPAYSGIFAENISFISASSFNQGWNFSGSFKNYNYGFFAGLNLKDNFDIPLSVGISYFRNYYDWGKMYYIVPESNTEGYEFPYDNSNLFTISAAYNSFFKLSFGITYKNMIKFFREDSKSEFSAFDLGVISNFPVSNLIPANCRVVKSKDYSFSYDIDYMLGFSLRNLGDRYHFADPAQSDPLTRELNLGHSLTLNTSLEIGRQSISPFSVTTGIDVHEELIELNSGQNDYESIPGSIRFFDNFIIGQGDSGTRVSKGYIVSALETITIYGGCKMGGPYSPGNINGSGFMLESAGVLKIFDMIIGSKTTALIANHFNLRYYYGEYFSNGFEERSVNFLQLEVKNITSLF